MFKWLFGGLYQLIDIATWVILAVAVAVFLIGLVMRRVSKVPLPNVAIYQTWAGWLALFMGAIKAAMFIGWLLTAQAKIDDLERQVKGKQDRIEVLEQNAGRKQEQNTNVQTSDAKADVQYRTRYRTIESIREVPDLSLANRLATDLTINFYEGEGNAVQAVPSN